VVSSCRADELGRLWLQMELSQELSECVDEVEEEDSLLPPPCSLEEASESDRRSG